MLTSAEAVYLDSSGLVKLVRTEAESADLERFLVGRPRQVSCVLAKVELLRAVRLLGPASIARAQELLDQLKLVRIDDALLEDAARLDPLILRSLDAIHLAAALSLGRDLAVLVTYDTRMTAAALQLGITVEAPGRSP